MKTLKDLTLEQAVEIAELLFPFPEIIQSEMKAKYYKSDVTKGDFENDEEYSISFDAKLYGKSEHLICHIYPSLDCCISTYEFIKYDDPRTDGYYLGKDSYPVRNQYKIQKKFREWNIEPKI